MEAISARGTTLLREIRLKNLAIARDVTVPLSGGLNVLTGSTGAGKSLVVQAVRWLRGEKTDETLIRRGEEKSSAEAVFDLSGRDDLLRVLTELGLEPGEDGLLTLRRELRRNGKSAAFVDGRRTSAAHLSRICSQLLQLQSQHQQTKLLDPSAHVRLLDDCGVDPGLREEWRQAWKEWRMRREEMETWRRRNEAFQAQREIYEYQRRELEEAALVEGEMEALRERVALAAGGARLLEAAQEANQLLDGEESGALGQITAAAARLAGLPPDIEVFSESGELLMQAEELVLDAARQLERFLDAAHFDPAQLDADQARLARLEELTRKYGRSEHELIAYLQELQERLAENAASGEPPAELAKALQQATERLQSAASALSKARRKVARSVARQAAVLLGELGMPQAELSFALTPRSDPEGELRVGGSRVHAHRDGPERVQLLVRANPGESLAPLEKAASGGELSRIGLILRSLAVQGRQPALLVLDEVDAGVGADLGPAIARRLAALSTSVQILAITHLPAVAAVARQHLLATKDQRGERTLSRVEPVFGKERLAELTRMIGGARREAEILAQSLLAEAGGTQQV